MKNAFAFQDALRNKNVFLQGNPKACAKAAPFPFMGRVVPKVSLSGGMGSSKIFMNSNVIPESVKTNYAKLFRAICR